MKNKKLNELLANIAILKQKAYNLHWNVRGIEFMEMHEMTQKLFEGLDHLFDEVAEKVAMRGETPISTLAGYIKESSIKEIEAKSFTYEEVVTIVVNDLNTLGEIALSTETNEWIQPILDNIFVFIDKQRWLFKSSK